MGLALAAKTGGRESRAFCLLGDGELAERSSWEAAMTGAHYQLDNLTAIVDRNRLQITGSTEEVNPLEPFAAKWRAFGWEVHETDGNDVASLLEELGGLPFQPGKPSLLIANTVKGRGGRAGVESGNRGAGELERKGPTTQSAGSIRCDHEQTGATLARQMRRLCLPEASGGSIGLRYLLIVLACVWSSPCSVDISDLL